MNNYNIRRVTVAVIWEITYGALLAAALMSNWTAVVGLLFMFVTIGLILGSMLD